MSDERFEQYEENKKVKTFPVFKIAVITTVSFLITRKLRFCNSQNKGQKTEGRSASIIDNIMRGESNVFVNITPEDIIDSTCNEMD